MSAEREETMMNTRFAFDDLKNSERLEALKKEQGFDFVHSYKIWQMWGRLWESIGWTRDSGVFSNRLSYIEVGGFFVS